MSLREDIIKQQTEALKGKEELRLSVLRMLWSVIQNEEIEKKRELSDEEIQQQVARQIKQLRDSLQDFVSGGRKDLSEKAEQEIQILEGYLPKQLSNDELRQLITNTIEELGGVGSVDLGKLMGSVMKKVGSQANGNKVRELALEILSFTK
ncbi:GatB/YqeY domain-containing protein [Patescibacteria group bacterium]|nr:GatB/YqeY domain-containing protein [Patescibacteria group bacterium]